MLFPKLLPALSWAGLASLAAGMSVGGKPDEMIKPYKRAPLQDIVTWDQHSIFVHGERIMLFNGEFHPYRLPVPSLWLDVFQKLKSAGFSGVSFYTHWAQLEGKAGDFSAEGVFALEPFFDAAKEAGIYLVARPGPYINAESSGGGFPGWLTRNKASERTPSFLPLTENYVKQISQIIAKGQITNGGPVILLQPENEYTFGASGVEFPNKDYMQAVEDMFRNNGIVVPFVSNDAYNAGHFAPGTGNGSVDIYGHDGYPLGFDCANPTSWPAGSLPSDYLAKHLSQSPTTPFTLSEFQGGSFDPWGGQGFAKCAALLGPEFERVLYKNNYAVDVTIFSLYMVYGGTNWGNLGHPGGYTSYDYGAIIAEDRTITREKYSEAKLQTNFFKVSPTYLVSTPHEPVNGTYTTSADLTSAQLSTNTTNIYVVRHSDYTSLASTGYKLQVPTSQGNLTIPQLGGSLTLNGRDSKMHVTDYNVGGVNMLYSSAEVFTWKKYDTKTVLVLYGGPGETHEAAFVGQKTGKVIEGTGVLTAVKDGSIVINWGTTSARKIVQFPSGLYVYLLDRNEAYNYWVIDLPAAAPAGNFTTAVTKSVIAKAGYLIRTATISGSTLALTGDTNATTPIEVIGGAPSKGSLTFNGKAVKTTTDKNGVISGTIAFSAPSVSLPALSSLGWKYIDSLPEIQASYSDAGWLSASHTTSNNTVRNITTPTSLYASDYGFNTGNLVTRGHFVATGAETTLQVTTQGGTAYAAAVYLNSTLLQGFAGTSSRGSQVQSMTFPKLTAGAAYVITVLTDNMGLDEDFTVGSDQNKNPRGVLDYALGGREQSAVSWKIQGNEGGEDYADRVRGPLNEGGLYAERKGYHLPGAPTGGWKSASPFDGVKQGVGFYVAELQLNLPAGWDVPLSFAFTNTTAGNYRAQLYVNGWQFGKFVNNIGPQTSFPVPEGILNYGGSNTIALSLWGFDAAGNKLTGLELVSTAVVQTGYHAVELVPQGTWSERKGAN